MLKTINKVKKKYNNPKAYVALLTVLIVGAIGISVTISLLLLGLASARTSFSTGQSAEAKSLTNACVEEALEQIRSSSSFASSSTIILDSGSCSYTVINTGGNNRTINASSTVGTLVRKATIYINQINPTINIASWQEVSD